MNPNTIFFPGSFLFALRSGNQWYAVCPRGFCVKGINKCCGICGKEKDAFRHTMMLRVCHAFVSTRSIIPRSEKKEKNTGSKSLDCCIGKRSACITKLWQWKRHITSHNSLGRCCSTCNKKCSTFTARQLYMTYNGVSYQRAGGGGGGKRLLQSAVPGLYLARGEKSRGKCVVR